MTLLDSSTPEQHRARYDELKRNAQARLGARPERTGVPAAPRRTGVPAAPRRTGVPAAPRRAVAADIVRQETIPDGWYATFTVPRGNTLQIINPGGRASVSALIWNADDTSERYNAGDTVKLQWNARPSEGYLLFSDMGRVLASITGDSGAGHDTLVGGSNKATNERRYGPGPLRNTRDNFCLAAAKLGLGRRDIMPCITFFAPVHTTRDGGFAWRPDTVNPRDFVELRAEMNLLVVLSNCPHPLDPRPDYAPGSVEVNQLRTPSAAGDDPCRTASEEAIRGFENTDAYFHL